MVKCLAPLWGPSGVRSCLENWYQGLRSFTLAYPWLISLHASGVTQNTRELAVEAPVSRGGNRQLSKEGTSAFPSVVFNAP